MTAAVRRDLAAISQRHSALAQSGLALSALALARQVDDTGNSATAIASCARQLRETLDRLRELAPEEEGDDNLDNLQLERAERQAQAGGGQAPTGDNR